MQHALESENIEELRRKAGIDDVELRAEIRINGNGLGTFGRSQFQAGQTS